MKFISTILISLFCYTSQAQVTASFFGEHFLGPFQSTFRWPSTNPSTVRPYLFFWCNPRVCTGGNIGGTVGTRIMWRDLEYAPNTFDFAGVGKLLDSLQVHNAEMVYTVGRVPSFYSSQPGLTNYYAYPPTDTSYLGRFLRALGAYAKNRGTPIRTWEIWNEPETGSSEWADTSWNALAKMGRCVYTNVKAMDPTYTVLTPSTQGSGADFWMEKYFKAGGAPNCDVVAYHAYLNMYSGGSQEKFEVLADKMRALMVKYGIGSKQLWDDEGFDNFFVPSGTIAPQNTALWDAQSAYLAQRYLISAAKGLNRVYWYAWDQNNGGEWMNVGGTYIKNPVGTAHEVIRSWMIGATVSNLQINSTTGVYSVDLTKNGVMSRAVWTRTSNTTYNIGSFTQSEDLTGTTTTLSGSTVTIGSKPILLKTTVVAKRAYYISNSGNDTWAGTAAAPYKTFAKAKAVAVKGDSILYKAGETYATNNNYIDPGKDDVFIGVYGSGTAPVIDGGVTIAPASLTDAGSGWKAYTNASFGAFLNIVSMDGRPQKMARFPANSWRKIHAHSGTSYIIDTTLSELGKDFTGWQLAFKPANWQINRVYVWKQNGDTLFVQTAAGQKASSTFIDGWGYFLQNGRTEDPSFGDFYFDATAKKVYVYYGSESPSNHTLRAAISPNAFNVSATGITFKGLHFTHFNQWGINKGSAAHGGSFINNEADNCGEEAIYMVAMRNWTVTGNNFHDNLSVHLKALENSNTIETGGANNWLIANNTFRRAGIYEGMGFGGDPVGSAIYVGGDSTRIWDNRIDSAGYNGIHTRGMGLSILRNYITNTNFNLVDGGGIYNFGSRDSIRANNAWSVIRHNIVFGSGGTKAGVNTGTFDTSNKHGMAVGGVYLDEHSKKFLVDSNSFSSQSWAPVVLNGTHEAIIRNNTLFVSSQFGLYTADFEPSGSLQATGNRFVSNTVSIALDNSGITPNPQNGFVDFHNLYQRTPSTVLFTDSNRYYTFASPTSNLFYRQYLSAWQQQTFAQWKTYTGFDANTTITQKTSHNFFYNPTSEAIGQTWDGWQDGSGTPLSGLLQPYSSKIGFNQVVTYTPQSIVFSALAAKTYGDAAFSLSATASSGLAVTYASSNTSVATVSGNTVTIIGAGTTNITASQAGNGTYSAAPDVVRTLTVLKANQSIAFPVIAPKITTDVPFSISATATSGLPVTFAVSSGPASVSGSSVTLTGTAGTVVVTANQAGNSNYNAATQASQSFAVTKANQTVSFPAITNKLDSDVPFTISATATSGLSISFSIVSGPASITGNTITLTGAAGTVTVQAAQAGDGTYNAATPVQQTFTVDAAIPDPLNQTIAFTDIADKVVTDAPFTISATASSGLAVSYAIISGPATITGNTVTITGIGDVTVEAAQAGNGTYNAAPSVQQTFTVTKAGQTISFNAIGNKIASAAPFTITATASSGLPATLSVVSGPATIAGNVVTLTGTGTVVIQATQAGDGTYNAASAVSNSFAVTASVVPSGKKLTLNGKLLSRNGKVLVSQ